MYKGWHFMAGLLLCILAFTGCGSHSNNINPQSGVPVSVTMKDTPPSGVAILSFELEVTGASLQPSTMGQSAVSLIPHPDDIELENLQTNSILLNTASVPPGTYQSLMMTFANPELTVQNDSAQPYMVGGQTCAPGQTCQLQPPLNPASVTLSAAPFPLTMTTGVPIELALDFNLNASVLGDLSISPVLSVSAVPISQQGQVGDHQEIAGQVTAIGTNQFTLTDIETGQPLTVTVDNNTEYEDFAQAGCTADNFSCLQVNQFVNVEFGEMDNNMGGGMDSNGGGITTLVATQVSLEDTFGEGVDGTITSVNPTAGQFQMVIEGEQSSMQGAAIGNVATVTVNPGAAFAVDSCNLTVPSGFSFASINDLMPGQNIMVHPVAVTSGASGPAITTDSIRLNTAQVTGTVSAVNGSNFTLGNLSPLFVNAGITQLQVQTLGPTGFEDMGGMSNIAVNDVVSVAGLLFKTPNGPVLLAERVRLHQMGD